MEDNASEVKKDGGVARLIIADDHRPTRSNLKKIFEGQPDLEVIAEAANGREVLELCSETRPDLVLMDVRMPEMNGIEATRRIKARHPRTVVLMATAFEDPDYMREALEAGAAGYILKHADPEEFLRAVRKALSGEFPLDTEVSSRLLRSLVGEGRARRAQETPGPPTEAVRIRLLGGFRVSVGSRIIEGSRWPLKKAGSLVKILALARGHGLHREQILDLLWPNLGAKSASNNFHRTLHFARKTLGNDPADTDSRYLRLERDLLALCPGGPLWVDVEAFEKAAAAARRSREPAAYRAAIDLYAGELLPEDLYEEWTQERREELTQLLLALLVELADLYEERDEYDRAIEALRRVVADEPPSEEAHLGLMRLYALSGNPRRAIDQYERLERALGELGAEPGAESRRLREEISAGRFPRALLESRPSEEGAAGRHNLPNARTSFVGREREMVEVKRSLAMTGVLTLTGTGGSGKTRLALEVARDLVGAYPDGVWLVKLAPLSDPALLPQAVASALDVREQPGRPLADTLADHLRAKDLLLVMDNCEHLVDAAADLAEALLSACPKLRILTTSREPLSVSGEALWPVPPLSSPDGDGESFIEGSMRSEAVRLFVERARSRLPDFELTKDNAGAVARVCRKLDGIPLAIELATARMGALAVEQVAQRLEASLKLLTAGDRTTESRHRTMRATLDWSFELLSEPEQKLFGRLSVFAGGWTLEAAEAVCSGEGIEQEDILDLLGGLVDKSLVVAEAEQGASRYRMLEHLRQYGREKLESAAAGPGEAEQVRRRHAEHYLALAETAEPELLGGGQSEWFRRLRTELGNLRAALSWSVEPGQEGERAQLGLRLVAALWRFWDVQGFEEGKGWLQTALEKDPGGFPAVRAKALAKLGFILLFQQDYGRAIAALEEAIALYKELGDASGAALALGNFGYAVLHGDYRERVPAFVQEAEALMQGDLDGHARAYLRIILACVAMEEGDLDSAVAQLEESLALCRELGDLRNTSMSLFVLGMTELQRDDLDRGATLLEEGARITRELGDRLGSLYFASGLGKVSALRGKPVRAARLWGAAEALREHMGMSLSHFDLAQSGYERDLAAVRSTLDEASFDAAWAEGRALSPEQAVEYALGAVEEPTMAPVAPVERPALTGREEEIAALVASGLTNRQIAQELTISARTVDTHVARILKKLGLHSREQLPDRLGERRQHEAG